MSDGPDKVVNLVGKKLEAGGLTEDALALEFTKADRTHAATVEQWDHDPRIFNTGGNQ